MYTEMYIVLKQPETNALIFLYYTLYYSSNKAGHRQYLNNKFKTVRNGVQKQIQYYCILLYCKLYGHVTFR